MCGARARGAACAVAVVSVGRCTGVAYMPTSPGQAVLKPAGTCMGDVLFHWARAKGVTGCGCVEDLQT
jgi:hypothetical protein